MTIGERIKQVRQTLCLTQAQFAERVNISTSYVAEMERGKKIASERTVRIICMEFDIDAHWLRTGDGVMYYEAAAANLARITGIFKSLSPQYQECALKQIKILYSLYNTNIN